MSDIELSVVMPCLNEAETLATCIRKARGALEAHRIAGEVIVADNGSTDGSQQIAVDEGAKVVDVEQKGYGSALIGGIRTARGKYVIMGDADDSYDFSSLKPFLDRLREGADLVMGNRFQGGIAPGAMPFLHRYVGNPVLSWLGRLFFGIEVGDFHCGLRGFVRDRVLALHLRTTGMEFASEMIVRSALTNYNIAEVPTTLSPDGRSRAPHLRTWRDGWRHLSFLLMYSPKWLFFYPGIALIGVAVLSLFLLLPGAVTVGRVQFDIHTFIVASFLALVGIQAISFSIIAWRFAVSQKLLPMPRNLRKSALLRTLSFERILIGAGLVTIIGFFGLLWCVIEWASVGFGPLEYSSLLRTLTLSMTLIAIGIQGILVSFLSAIAAVPTQ